MLRGFLFGLTVAAAIGPIALLILNTSLRFGLSAGIRSAFGAATADLIYAIGAALLGAAALGAVAQAQHEIKLAASLLLIAMGPWLVIASLRASRKPPREIEQTPRAYLVTLGLTLVNPLTMLTFAAFIAQGPTEGARDMAGTVIGVFLGSLVVQLLLAFSGAGARRLFAAPQALLALNVASGSGIIAFGLAGLLIGS